MNLEVKLKHLEFIQNVITRMNNCSFLIKGWSITLVSALFAFAAKDVDTRFVLVAYFPAIVFWVLDGFFLNQERRYRDLYNLVSQDSEEVPNLEMNTTEIKSIQGSWAGAAFSKTLFIFHGIVILMILIVMFGFILNPTQTPIR